MQRFEGIEQVPVGFGPSVASLGNYDGLHLGHSCLVEQVVARASELSLVSAVVTFDPHPATVHQPDCGLIQVQSLEERLAGLEALGLDVVLIQPYTLAFAALSPAEFVQRYFVDGLQASEVVVGQDVRFGAGNQGDLATMIQLGQELGFLVTALEDQGDKEDERASRFSSSDVRAALAVGDVAQAARILGRAHQVSGVVVHGDGRGHTLGFPTANLGGQMSGMVPADGVYAGWLVRPGLPPGHLDKVLPAAISIGTNPTFGGRERRVEAFVPGRVDLELYGESVALRFTQRLRHTLEFQSTNALVTQMHDDAAAALRALAGTTSPL
jgi:riboflavin kinase/FMN adenylyltransferase